MSLRRRRRAELEHREPLPQGGSRAALSAMTMYLRLFGERLVSSGIRLYSLLSNVTRIKWHIYRVFINPGSCFCTKRGACVPSNPWPEHPPLSYPSLLDPGTIGGKSRLEL